MAAVAARPVGAQPKMKKPSVPLVQTNTNVKAGQHPSSSPSSATKRLPGQPQSATPVSATPASANANASRPNRRLQRLSTRGGTVEALAIDKRTARKHPEPFVPKASHILKKFKGKPPSLIVHLHPTHFRFDQQDGSFSYHSEMRMFIENLQKGTIPLDMVEDFRRSEVQFYDGWLIVRVVDHRTVNHSAGTSNNSTDDGKPFSIHNYNPYITPSPYAPYPTKDQTGQRSPQQNKDGTNGTTRSDEPMAAPHKTGRAEPKTFHVALRPTMLSRHADLVIDAMAPDPKSLNRKQSQANTSGRAAAGAPPTPVSGVPSTPATERGPPLKKQKMKIDAKDLLEYEARILNATAPPLYLDAVDSFEEAEAVIALLRDPYHDAPPPSAKSRKRTVAELAADDAHAKQQERFMLIMDERNAGNAGGGNAAALDQQAAGGMFQPRFEKFNALENIKRDIAERKQREKDKQLQEDENRRGHQERQAEEDRRRMAMIQRQRENNAQRLRQQQEMQANAHKQATAQAAATQRQQQQQQQQQASSIPPQMQSQMMAAQSRSSPIIRQGTPHAASSPNVNNPQGGQAMVVSSSQQGAGSPQRPGSAVQHGHPAVAMARGPSGQGPSRHGTPQIPHSTPGMRNATPVMRQGTPAQHMTQASPHGSMMAPTPQMAQAATMQGQVQGGMPQQQQQYTQQQYQQMRQQALQQQQAAMRGQQMVNGTPQMQSAQVADIHAQQQRQAAMQRMQQQQALQQQGNPPTPQMVQSPAQGTAQYKQQLGEQMKAQMQQSSNQGSPAPGQMTPQQQHAAQLAHQQQQQQQQRMMQQNQQNQMMAGMNPQMQQQQQQQQQQARFNVQQMPPQMQQFYQNALQTYQAKFMQQSAVKYGGNTGALNPSEMQHVNAMAQRAAQGEVQKRRMQAHAQAQAQVQGHATGQQMQQQQAQQAALRQQQQQGGGMPNGMMNMQGHPNAGAQGGNMNLMLQQQQALHMQQMQMAQAQQHVQAQHQGGGGGMQGNNMASIHAYQQQLAQMSQQGQQQQRQG